MSVITDSMKSLIKDALSGNPPVFLNYDANVLALEYYQDLLDEHDKLLKENIKLKLKRQ